MKRFFVSYKLDINNDYIIDGIEHNHIKNVMRLNVGDDIILVCGDEYDYFATITKITKGDTTIHIKNKQLNIYNPKSHITVFQALVKSDNMSLIIQKLTELGVENFIPFESEFITSKDKYGKSSKFQEISNQSIKQCKRSIPMNVHNTFTFQEMLEDLANYDVVIFANECERSEKLNNIEILPNMKVAIIIGSEGGFNSEEIEKLSRTNAKSVTLGKRILRAETSAIALTSVVAYLLGEWNYD